MANELKKGTFIKWTAKDQQGSFSHVGQIFSIKDGHVVMSTSNGGAMGFDLTDGTVEVTRKPKTWGVAKACDVEVEVPKTVTSTTRAPHESNGVSKKDRAFQSYRDLKCLLAQDGMEPTRKVVIDMFVRDLGMTPAGASTYASMVMRLGASAKG